MKKPTIVIMLLLIMFALSACLTSCINPNGGGKINGNDKILDPLPDLIDYASESKYYNVNKINYSQTARQNAINDLQDKQDEENEKEWTDDTTTFTKIFCNAEVEKIVERMAMAAIPQDRMTKLVTYITRADYEGPGYALTKGTGSAIQDYEDLDHLYELYDDDVEYENPGDQNTVYYNLQMKRRKVMAEIYDIFGNDGDQVARLAMEELLYAQDVVENTMLPEYQNENPGHDDYGFDDYFKHVFFDYEALVYFKAFNQTALFNNSNYSAGIDANGNGKPKIVQLYGYYYQYEKGEYLCFNNQEFERYLELSEYDYFEDNALALEYANLDRKHYKDAYRYSADFYKKYYTAHFDFQSRQETFDKEVYGISAAIPTNTNLTYSGQMIAGLHIGMASTLLLSDINYEYTGKNQNVTSYNEKDYAYNKLSEDDKELPINAIYEVELQVEQLKSQYYATTHKLVKDATYKDLTKALQYQIYSYSGDYIRGIQSFKKDEKILDEEIKRLDPAAPDYESVKAQKEEEIGRNAAMRKNLESNYGTSNPAGQITKADQISWEAINEEIKAATDINYNAYHNQMMPSGRRRYESTQETQVDTYFENNLIKQYWKKGNETRTIEDEQGNEEQTGWTKEYDTDHNISRMLNNHETVFRYAYGQIKVTYKEGNYKDFTVKNEHIKANYIKGSTYASGAYNGSGVLSTPDAVTKRPTSYSDFRKETIETDETPTLCSWGSNKWTGYFINTEQGHTEEIKEGTTTYIYYFEFAGWFVDTELKYRVKPDEKYDYDVAFYPGYYITKVVKPNK